MPIIIRDWNTSQFYMTPSSTLADQFQKVIDGIAPVRKYEDGATVFATTPGQNRLSDILLGQCLGDNVDRLKVRVYNDYTNLRLTFQKNTGTDASPTWVDLFYISTTVPYTVTFAGGFSAGGSSTIDGSLTLGGNLDLNNFYIRNLSGINGVSYSIAGKKYSQDFTSASEVTVNHDLQTKDIGWSVQDNRNFVIIPETIAVQDANTVAFYFRPQATGRLTVFGGMGEVGITFNDGTESFLSTELHPNPSHFYLTRDTYGKAVLNLQSTDHGALTGLTDDDHTQYIRVDGTRRWSGKQLGSLHVDNQVHADEGFYGGYGRFNTNVAIGNLGTEDDHITVNGVTYKSSLKISDIGSSEPAQVHLHRHSTNSNLPPVIIASKSHSATSGHSIVLDDEILLSEISSGWTSGEYTQATRIDHEVDGTPGASDLPGRIVFKTTPSGSATPVEALRLDSNQRVVISLESAANDAAAAALGIPIGGLYHASGVVRIRLV